MNAHPYPSNRRQWLRAQVAGALGLSWPGLSLPGLWQAQAAASEIAPAMGQLVPRIRSCIFIFYYGGPSHLDTFDLKPQAPAEVRGEFQPVATTVPGLWICEHLPRMARQMHKVALVRSLHHANRLHDSASIETLTGRPSPHGDREEFSPIPQFFPGYGAILSYLWRERGLDVPHAGAPLPDLLMARRLVEAGIPFVNVADFRQQGQNWDSHAAAFPQQKDHLLPQMDQSLSALIEDLDQRGLLDTPLVVALGEFGRTPTINQAAGRDHWPDCYTALLAGGGVKGGHVFGASDGLGAYPALDPVTPADLAATIFWRFGIDPSTHLHDLTGRPFPVADGRPLVELFDDAA